MTDTDLRWRLRQLPREIEPARDLWPGIAARLDTAPRRQGRAAWGGGLALAASLLLAFAGWRLAAPPAPPAAGVDPVARVVQTEARALTLEYNAALAEYRDLPLADEAAPGIEALDRSARDIRSALAAAPGSVRLLQQLQRTYTRRLELTQRAVAG
jgi:hypothetical protein